MTLVEIVNVVSFLTFTFLLFVGLTTTILRRAGLAIRRIPPPRLLPRDLALMLGLAWPFTIILLFRAFGLTELVVGQLWWTLVTAVPAILGIGTYVYYEIFVIGQPDNWRQAVRHLFKRNRSND